MDFIKFFFKRKLFKSIDDFLLSDKRIFQESVYIYTLLKIDLEYVIYKILKRNNIIVNKISQDKKEDTIIIRYDCKYKWEQLIILYKKNKKYISIYKLYNF